MTTITIDSQAYVSYADLEDADLYLAAAFHAANWTTAADLTKAQALVTAARILDRQRWLGEKTDSDQVLAWPRTNTGLDDVDESTIPDDIVNASIELALALVDGAAVQTEQNTSQKIQSLSAGSVSITYFRGAEGEPLRFPLIVTELIKVYLAGAGASFLGLAAGVDGEAASLDFGHSGPI